MTWLGTVWAWIRKRWIAMLAALAGLLYLLWRSERRRRVAAEAEAGARERIAKIEDERTKAHEAAAAKRERKEIAARARAAERRRLAREASELEAARIAERRRKDAETVAKPGGAADLWNAHHGRGGDDGR